MKSKRNILFMTSNHQTTNLDFPNLLCLLVSFCFLQIFHEFFSAVWEVEKENKLFIGPKIRKRRLIWISKKFFFQQLKLFQKRGNYSRRDIIQENTVFRYILANNGSRSLQTFQKIDPLVMTNMSESYVYLGNLYDASAGIDLFANL